MMANLQTVPDGKYILHRCDNRRCVNHEHLFVGDHQANMDDMNKKGRRAPMSGEKNPRARLSPEDVAAIRADPRSQRAIAKDYGISKTQVGNIKRGERWTPDADWHERTAKAFAYLEHEDYYLHAAYAASLRAAAEAFERLGHRCDCPSPSPCARPSSRGMNHD